MILHRKSEALKILLNQEILCMINGPQAEIGPRALGGRSMLFDPRNENGKDIVNEIKQRENYRPFAGVVLAEHAKFWFDMGNIKESPYMLYSIPVLENKKRLIPSIVHVDGTCRIQTVTEEQNKHLYELLMLFLEATRVPILLNTSLNLAGEPLVNNLRWAKKLVERSKLKYLYFPGVPGYED